MSSLGSTLQTQVRINNYCFVSRTSDLVLYSSGRYLFRITVKVSRYPCSILLNGPKASMASSFG